MTTTTATTAAGEGSAPPPLISGPLISVIVATYNSRVTLACALDSVRRQDCGDFEVQVVGDACTDGSHEVVEALGDPRFHWINRETNSGSQSAPNADGLKLARGRYVAYLGHDDLWFPWHLSTLLAAIERDEAAFAHGLGLLLGPDEQLQVAGPPPRGVSYARHFVPPTNWLHRRDLLERVGSWQGPERLAWAIDADVMRRIAASGAVITSASRLTTIKFPSPWWRLYAPDSPRPQLAMRDELMRDPAGLAERLLIAIAGEHARTRYPMRDIQPSDALREAAWYARRAFGTWMRRFDETPFVAPLIRWRFQHLRQKVRRQRGLT
jgi:glycosyltransferase involved in cell wall biosynthesis